jgi:deoxyribose-phosphate aldolase
MSKTAGARSKPLLDRARELVARAAADSREPTSAIPTWLGPGAAQAPGLGQFIDHTLLKPETTREQILSLCDEAVGFGVKAVCVNGCWVELCAERLAGTPVLVATVVGFPLGAMASDAKAAEAGLAVAAGASEVDMVMALGSAKSGDWGPVEDDIRCVVEAARPAGVKVILETAALTPEEIVAGSLVSGEAGAAFVKTSTGFHPAGGATRSAVRLMRLSVGSELGVKASGGIRTSEAALEMLAAGANRIGTSSTSAMAPYVGSSAPPLGELLNARRSLRS